MRKQKVVIDEEVLAKAAKEHNISLPLVRVRLCRGWSLEHALNTPPQVRHKTEKKILYPRLMQWIEDNNLTLLDACISFDIGDNTLPMILYGFNDPSKRTIDKMLAVTGIPYEELFKESQ